jgi:L-asparaginase II
MTAAAAAFPTIATIATIAAAAAAAPHAPGTPPHVPLAVVTRGDGVDAVHFGSVAVVDFDGNVLHAAGDPHFVAMTRSALKPFQAMPFAAAGGIERFGYAPAQVALMCASHAGEPRHVSAVADMLARAGNTAADLQCGSHAPGYYDVRGEVPPPPPYSPLAHNCSGKHSGMRAHCVLCGLPKDSYLAYDHPLQQAIRGAVAHFTGVPDAALLSGIDGCSAPNYAVPLSGLARAFARLAGSNDDGMFGAAPRKLAAAMTAHPEMVSGEGRNDLAYMRAGRGDWVTKIGAEAIQAIGVRSRGIGIVVKVADGAKRALHPATVAVLDQLGLLDAAQRAELAAWALPQLRNYRGTVTGAVRPLVVLERPPGATPQGSAAAPRAAPALS